MTSLTSTRRDERSITSTSASQPTAGDSLGAITAGVLQLGARPLEQRAYAQVDRPDTAARHQRLPLLLHGLSSAAADRSSRTAPSRPGPTATSGRASAHGSAADRDRGRPDNGGAVGAGVLNDRGYFDVTYHVPDYASTIDAASVTDLDPEFTVSGAAVTLDTTRAPVLISQSGKD